ncbi:hypothetical protein ACFLWY_00895 [Chloroflexota bacterium]
MADILDDAFKRGDDFPFLWDWLRLCWSPFLGRLVIILTPAVLLILVVKHALGDVVSAAKLRGAAFAAHQFLHHPSFEF